MCVFYVIPKCYAILGTQTAWYGTEVAAFKFELRETLYYFEFAATFAGRTRAGNIVSSKRGENWNLLVSACHVQRIDLALHS